MCDKGGSTRLGYSNIRLDNNRLGLSKAALTFHPSIDGQRAIAFIFIYSGIPVRILTSAYRPAIAAYPDLLASRHPWHPGGGIPLRVTGWMVFV